MLLETLVAVLFECAEPGIYLVTLNRPERLNAADTPTKAALGEIMGRQKKTTTSAC